MSRMTPEQIQLECRGIDENLHNVRRAIDELLFVISDLSEDEPSCSVNGPCGHVENAFKAAASALMLLNEAEGSAMDISNSQVALPEAAE